MHPGFLCVCLGNSWSPLLFSLDGAAVPVTLGTLLPAHPQLFNLKPFI